MQVLLKRNVENLGRVGDVVKVKPGYARNWLLPTGRAVVVNAGNLAEIERLRARAQADEQERIKQIKELAASMVDASVTIEGRANEDGHLFGSVTAAQIAAALRAKGFPIEENHVRLEAPLKEIGVFDVRLHLHAEVDAQVKVWVVQAKPV
ncbi:MAG TPA: 50S ribosomal protein L9 [Planctomycetota bacterium]|nr:50S ribosomal protein L9 [Planctomycetota bacterium]